LLGLRTAGEIAEPIVFGRALLCTARWAGKRRNSDEELGVEFRDPNDRSIADW